MKVLEKRVGQLERHTGGPQFVCILNLEKETPEQTIARWESANGALGSRQPIVVNFVDAAI